MAKTTAKRKSESALPTGKTKQRKTSKSDVRKALESDLEGSQSGQELFVQEQSVAARHIKKGSLKSRKSEPARAYRDTEYEDDPLRTESQEFLSLVEFETKKKRAAVKEAGHYLDKLMKKITHDEQDLKDKLEALAATAAKRDQDFLGAFRVAYKVATPCPSSEDANQAKATSESRGFAFMYERSKQLTKVATGLAARFEKVSQQVAGQDTTGLLENKWGTEDAEFTHLVLIGKELGISRCQGILNAGKEVHEISADKGAESLYSKEQRPLQWGKVARNEEKAARKLVKAIASAEE